MHARGSMRDLTVRSREDYAQVLRAVLQPRGGSREGAKEVSGAEEMFGSEGGPERGADLLKKRLSRSVLRAPLFDVPAWVNDFDQMARMMWDNHVAGEPIRHFIPARPTGLS